MIIQVLKTLKISLELYPSKSWAVSSSFLCNFGRIRSHFRVQMAVSSACAYLKNFPYAMTFK